MALSELGLTQAEVDSIMRDVAGEPALPGANIGGPNTNSTVTTTAKQPVSPVKTSDPVPPALNNKGQSLTQKVAAPSNGIAPAIVGATTGLIIGGPVGAVIGGAGMWLLNKAITPKS